MTMWRGGTSEEGCTSPYLRVRAHSDPSTSYQLLLIASPPAPLYLMAIASEPCPPPGGIQRRRSGRSASASALVAARGDGRWRQEMHAKRPLGGPWRAAWRGVAADGGWC